MPRIGRWLAGALVGALLSASVLISFGAPPAGAVAQEPVSVRVGATVVKTYGVIAGMEPGGQVFDPDDCDTVTFCDTIPVTVEVPDGLASLDDFRLKIELDYTTQQVRRGTVSTQLDLYAWDAPQGAAPIGQAVGANAPQFVTLDHPTKGSYQIVVHSTQGQNDGYALKFMSIFSKGSAPTEATEPSFEGGVAGDDAGSSGSAPAPRPTVARAGSPLAGAGQTPTLAEFAAPVTTPFVPSAPAVDADLAGLAGAAGSDPLAAATGSRSIIRRAKQSAAAPSPPGLLVAFWLGAVPLGLAALLGGLALRRRPGALLAAA